MVNRFLAKFSQVKAFVHSVFIVLLLVNVDAFSLLRNRQPTNTDCKTCDNEYRYLTKFFDDDNFNVTQRHWCAVFDHFLRCTKPLIYTCRTDLNFQASRSVMTAHKRNYDCGRLHLTWNETSDIISDLRARRMHVKLPPTQNTNRVKKCHQRPKFRPIYKICGLFGDPHLRTFNEERHTCSVPGAWPLFANRHLTVQVTNIPLDNGSRATATSKVTVIVRGLKRQCIQQKTYQAKSFSLPSVFSDGTKSSDDEECPTTIRPIAKGRVIQLNICPLKTKIIIRQVGKYLTVHMRVPKDLMKRQTIGLCKLGCPRIEQMNVDKTQDVKNQYIASLYAKDTVNKRTKRQRRKRARKLCRAARVTGFYYRSCLFDLLTSGDESFVKSARAAMKDFRRINIDDRGRPIVNETERNSFTGPTKGPDRVLMTSNRPTLRTPSSSAATIRGSILLASFLAFVLLSKSAH